MTGPTAAGALLDPAAGSGGVEPGVPALPPAGVAGGVRYLARLQHPAGSWTDFLLAPGTSDAWVTAFTGVALADVWRCARLDDGIRRLAGVAAGRAADWLLEHGRSGDGWAYAVGVRPDADSTAHVVSLLARLGRAVPPEALAFLHAHADGNGRYRTYRADLPVGTWTRPTPDVTAAVLRALHDAGTITTAGLAARWTMALRGDQDAAGWWQGLWWTTPAYPTGLVLEVRARAGHPPVRHTPAGRPPGPTAFDRAWELLARLNSDRPVARVVGALEASQRPDGGWPGGPILQVPPAHPGQFPPARPGQFPPARPGQVPPLGPEVAADARGVFTTASVVRALTAARAAGAPSGSPTGRAVTGGPPRRGPAAVVGATAARSSAGASLDATLDRVARAAGFGTRDRRDLSRSFRSLTAESLGPAIAWPAPQVSSLAAGTPMEFSVTADRRGAAAVRYAVEVGEPHLPPFARAASGLGALARTARILGYRGAWDRLAAPIRAVVHPEVRAPDGLRFWVWGGIDHREVAGGRVDVLKVYLNLLDAEVGDGRARLDACLRAAGVPDGGVLTDVLDLLDRAGFAHEVGFGIAPGGRVGAKVYYELPRWDRALTDRVVALAGLPAAADDLVPHLPGVLHEPLAAKSRSGIALRVSLRDGAIREVTSAAAFPAPLIGDRATAQRVRGWIEAQGWDGAPYRRLVSALLPQHEREAVARRFHGLVTRTVSGTDRWATVYARPALTEEGRSGAPPAGPNR